MNIEFCEHCGSKLRDPILAEVVRRRLMNGWTQKDLAEELKVTRGTMCNFENGVVRMGAGRFVKLARLLNLPSDLVLSYLGKKWVS